MPLLTTGDVVGVGHGKVGWKDLPGDEETGEGVGDVKADEVGDNLRMPRQGDGQWYASDVGSKGMSPGTAQHQLHGRGKTRRAKLWASGRSDAP